VIGRPNVGKSSLVNQFAGADRVIVNDVAGTTRDAIDLTLEVDGRPLVSSTPPACAARRRSRTTSSTTRRCARSGQAERADVALVVCDAGDGITAQDLRIADLAMKAGCATALVLNKWDVSALVEEDLEHERAVVTNKASPATQGADRERQDGPQRRPRPPGRRSRWETACAPASRRRS